VALDMIGVSLSGSFPQGTPAVAEMIDNARRVERLGYDAIWSGDHIIMHNPIMDVMTVLATYAAVTERVKIGTAVYLVPLRHPVATAKQVASLDLLSQGRFIFGVGVGGEIVREFNAVNVSVTERGRRTDEGLEIITRVLSEKNVTFEGKHFHLQDVTLEPQPQQKPYPPIWIGGRSPRSLRRALELADGWDPFGFTWEQLRSLLNRARDWPQWEKRVSGFDLALSPEEPLALDDPADVERVREIVESYRAIGATVLNLRFAHRSLQHFLEMLDRFTEDVAAFI